MITVITTANVYGPEYYSEFLYSLTLTTTLGVENVALVSGRAAVQNRVGASQMNDALVSLWRGSGRWVFAPDTQPWLTHPFLSSSIWTVFVERLLRATHIEGNTAAKVNEVPNEVLYCTADSVTRPEENNQDVVMDRGREGRG